LQDLKGGSVPIISLGLQHHILYGEGLPGVEIGGPLVNVTETTIAIIKSYYSNKVVVVSFLF
jgi:hypothetical protein